MKTSSQEGAGRRTVTRDPLNAETPVSAMTIPTPTSSFYVRNHFGIPDAEASGWQLSLEGRLERPRLLALDDLQAMHSKTLLVTMECAGNGRESLSPGVPGTAWGLGAISTGAYTGVPLRDLLAAAGPLEDAREIVFTGADRGPVEGGREVNYARSLTVAQAQDPDVLVAWALNDEPLKPEHGYPLRLVVPAWYGMASVKWLARIEAVAQPWHGFFQHEHYVFWDDAKAPDETPVTLKSVRSMIVQPGPGSALATGPQEIRGLAWAGETEIARVEVSVDAGRTWQPAALSPATGRYAAQSWRYDWRVGRPGRYTLMSRAEDSLGNGQPLEQRWNRLGYANNQVQALEVTVE